jgi:hypothetical protein
MVLRSSLLLSAVVLLAAIPVCADSILYIASTNEPANPESSAATFRTSRAKFRTPATVQFISEPLPASTPTRTFALPEPAIAQDSTQKEISGDQNRTYALLLTDPQNDARPSDSSPASGMLSVSGFQSGSAFAASGSENSWVLGTLVFAASEPGVHAGKSVAFDSGEPPTSGFIAEGSRFGSFGSDPDHGRGGKGKNKDQDGAPVNIPEPASLPLLTLGLLAVGIMARKNRDIPTNA